MWLLGYPGAIVDAIIIIIFSEQKLFVIFKVVKIKVSVYTQNEISIKL